MTHQKVALVTGAGTGIGKASALALLSLPPGEQNLPS